MKEYVISCNLKQFDLISHFEQNKTIVWKQTKPCDFGDMVYVYIGRPYSRLFYKCKVIEANISKTPEENSFYMNEYRRQKNPIYMRLEIIGTLPEKGLALVELQAHGLKTVQCSTQVSKELHDYILKIETRR